MSITLPLRPKQELDILEIMEFLGLDLNKLAEFVQTGEEISRQAEETDVLRPQHREH